MKIKVEKDYLKFFIINVCAWTFVYLLIIVMFSFVLPKTAVGENGILLLEEDFLKVKALLCHSLPSLFAVLAFSFYAMQLKEMYLLSSILMTGWLFEWMGKINTFEPETYLIMTLGIVLSLLVFLYPIEDWLYTKNEKFKYIHLVFSYLVVVSMDIVLFCYNKYIFPYRNIYNLVIRILIIILIMVVTMYAMHWKSKSKNFKEGQE